MYVTPAALPQFCPRTGDLLRRDHDEGSHRLAVDHDRGVVMGKRHGPRYGDLGGAASREIGLMRVVPVAASVLLPGLPGALQPSPAGSILRWICRQFAAPRYCPWLAGEVGDGQRDLDFSGSAPRPIVAPLRTAP